ncbi:putative metal-dependent hydrolase [Priestia megaterium]|nr:putative metal-dependent hydrolase [Priestia megaterium]
MENLKYPIGEFKAPAHYDHALRADLIHVLKEAPYNLQKAIKGLNSDQLNTPYRENGWTVSQVVHHLSDSHMNSYIRFKLALTENNPIIKPYDEKQWAVLPDTVNTHPSVSLSLLESLHNRWTNLLSSLNEEEFSRSFVHPETNRTMNLNKALALYAWHSEHHIAHITSLRDRMGWN